MCLHRIFLLLGTPLCPPELDFFNKASLDNLPNDSSEEESSDHLNNEGGMAARKTVRRIEPKKETKRKQNNSNNPGKKLPASVQALKKKYTEQRLAKKVVSKTIPASSSRRTRSQTEDERTPPKRKGMATRGAAARKKGDLDSRRGAVSPTKSKLELRKPSAATLVAKRKTRMATLTAASSRVSRMLTRLTPRGTTSAAFVRSTRNISMAGRSLRGRDISVSSEDEDSEEDTRQKKTPPKRRLKSRQSLKAAKKSEESESDADEENSSRDSSRRRTELSSRKLSSHSSKVQKREARSASWDSSASKESGNSYQHRKSGRAGREEDEVSVASSSDGRKAGRRDASSSKESTPIRKVITPSLKKKGNGNLSESERRKAKKEGGEAKDKRKSKQSLKELQDMLLEEAKKNMGPGDSASSTPNSRPESEERITISQKTGYIQVKPRKSTDQASSDEITVIAASPAMIGPNGRRLSKGGERTSTPPRKILPKPANDGESSLAGKGGSSDGPRSHLPVGVIGAAAMSSARIPMKVNGGSSMQQSVPLTQPLVINTGFSQPPQQQQQQQQPKSVAIAPNPSGITIPNLPAGTKVTTTSGMVMQQAVPPTTQNAKQSVHQTTAQTSAKPVQTPQHQGNPNKPKANQSVNPTASSMNSPGPPMLSPQASGDKKGYNTQGKNPTKNQTESQKKQHVAAVQSHQSSRPQPVQQQPTTVQGIVQPQPPQMQNVNPQLQQQQQQYMHQSPAGMQQPQQYAARPIVNVAPNTTQHFVQGYPNAAMPMQAFPNQQGAFGYAHPQGGIYPQQIQMNPMQQQPPFAQMQGYYPSQQQPQPPPQQQQQQQPLPQQQQPRAQPSRQQPNVPPANFQASSSKPLPSEEPKNPAKHDSSKQKTIYSKTGTPKASKSPKHQPSSFRVENEASPYAFEEAEQQSVPYRKTSSPSKAGPSKEAPKKATSSKSSGAKNLPESGSAIQCNLEEAKEMGSSIPIPKELANQLAAQAKKECTGGNSEMTYFIPLQSSSGQSFGVAVKLATEGPEGPNQKVIMKAKLVTQPSGKPAGARVIGAKETKDASSTPKSTSSKSSPQASTSGRGRKFTRMPVASPSSPAHSSDSDDSSMPSTSTGRMGSPDSFRSSKHKSKLDLRDDSECCLGTVETLEKFPKLGQHAHLVEAPVYTPTEKEFKDPMKFIESVRKEAEQFGVCRIVPPSSFKPECNVDDDMRFTAYNQMVHKMMNRWGPNAKEMAAIKKYLETQNVIIKTHPVVGGVEIDLPALYHAVQSFGGLTEVIQRKRWGKIADYLRIPKGTQDRGNKLDDIYCKYLLPYDTLSSVEREELLRLVEDEYEESYKRKLERSRNDDDDEDGEESEEDDDMECVIKGKSTSLSQFFRVARNLMTMIFKQADPDPREVEEEYWRLVLERDCHVQVQQGSIDTGDEGFGFPTARGTACGRHAWNLKILSNNPRSLLRCMGPVMGVTVPTLNVGMVFTSGCWYRDPHGLPWVEYHHTGSPKVWYSVPDSHSIAFYTAMQQLVPTFCRKKKIWLPADTAMVNRTTLLQNCVWY